MNPSKKKETPSIGYQLGLGSSYHDVNQADLIRVNKKEMAYMHTSGHHDSSDQASRLRSHTENYRELKEKFFSDRKSESIAMQKQLTSVYSELEKGANPTLTRREKGLLRIPLHLLSDGEKEIVTKLKKRINAPPLRVTLIRGLEVIITPEDVTIERVDNAEFVATLHFKKKEQNATREVYKVPLTLIQSMRVINDSEKLRKEAERAPLVD